MDLRRTAVCLSVYSHWHGYSTAYAADLQLCRGSIFKKKRGWHFLHFGDEIFSLYTMSSRVCPTLLWGNGQWAWLTTGSRNPIGLVLGLALTSKYAEQYNAVLPGTLTSIAYAGVAVIIVSLLLIPEPVASLWVSFSILSINVGILGFMTFWNVRLDFISMVTIVMSIGFCVDFAAHLAYNFAKGQNLPTSERMRNALYAVGAPILQSATSTILGVSFLASAESYVFKSFLKTIFLVIVLGVLHGLVVLPVLLTMFHCCCDGGNSNVSIDTTSIECAPPRMSFRDKVAIADSSSMISRLPSTKSCKLPLAECRAYLEDMGKFGRPPDYHEAAISPYPMRARLKNAKIAEMKHSEHEAVFCYFNPIIEPQ